MNNEKTILVIEDEKGIRNFIHNALTTNGYKTILTENGKTARTAFLSQCPDLVLLDLGLPDMDGVEIIRKVRSWSQVPIIVVSARSEDRDKVTALDEGADDFLTKPFSVEELLARVRVSLRRVQYQNSNASENSAVFKNGGLTIDYASGCVSVDGKEIHLTPIEYKLLCLLSRNVGKVLTHNFILNEVWGNVMQSDVPSLRVFMATLRKKIEKNTSEPEYIQTHIGIGYRMLRIEESEK